MALIVDGISPTAIEIDGNSDINVLVVDGVYYWGKPFTLTTNVDTNSSVVVTRTSSPYQNASLGILETGSLVYYGDNLSVEVSVADGYELNTFTINDIEYLSPVDIVVKETIIINVTSAQGLAWYTVWSGSENYVSSEKKTETHEMTIPNVDFSTCNLIRITGKTSNEGVSFLNSISYGESFVVYDEYNSNKKAQTIKVSSPNIINITTVPYTQGFFLWIPLGVIIEKVEVYK